MTLPDQPRFPSTDSSAPDASLALAGASRRRPGLVRRYDVAYSIRRRPSNQRGESLEQTLAVTFTEHQLTMDGEGGGAVPEERIVEVA